LLGLISGGIYASHDDGLTWTESGQGLSNASGVNVFSFLALPGQSGDKAYGSILAGTSQGIYMSRNQGATWTPSSVGIGTTRVISLARDPLAPTDVYAGADTGVYVSRDSGASWYALGFGLPANQHVGAVGVVHPVDSEQMILAAVDRLYQYPGHWLLASEPWRALGFTALVALALIVVGFVAWQARSLAAR
jgi:hypothetical protein